MDLVLFGMQGSGKGTQGNLIAKRHNLKTFETGAELRKLAQEDSPLGKKIKSIIEAGRLVDNEVVMEIIENFMKSIGKNDIVLFDGLPRKMEQAETFDTLMKKFGREFMGILIEISEKVAMKRLTTRRICKKCKEVYPATYKENTCAKCNSELITRNDDNVEAIIIRLQAYRNETLPVIQKYEREGKMIKINGEQAIENVDKDLEIALKHVL
ncbi:MAG: Adenylate kinase [uncultured bacterium]|nr:MAG: Adenylate kinase [uncultured bacterium]KKT02475.1 MAG: adenylate kinase, adenylate kinase [Candidatus Peregrinibacteria bacterium GW2011_GWF2_43_17]KKT19764.1 MAG: Adenylate kinase [Candidatus Peregrinibacteria bacterium GW2011_GWA2_43_8]HAU40197.1 adenylate kinase [Candidatus Peregrinibacteria bacterium]